MAECRFYRYDPRETRPQGEPVNVGVYEIREWRPGVTRLIPPGCSATVFFVWWLFHIFRLFESRWYQVVYIVDHNEELLHRSCIFPKYYRFPFMEKEHLQVGDTWTRDDYRGKGLAKIGLARCIEIAESIGVPLWYVTDIENRPSIRVCEALGFNFVGSGLRIKRYGLSILGQYTMRDLSQ